MDAPAISAASLRNSLASGQPPLVIDVRKGATFLGAPDLIRGALRRDPQRVAEWGKSLPSKADVVVYCVHGHEVSQNAATAQPTSSTMCVRPAGGRDAHRPARAIAAKAIGTCAHGRTKVRYCSRVAE